MNHRSLIRICALVALLSVRAVGDNPAQPHDRKVRVVCRFIQTYFDVSVSLKPFADDISPRAFLDAVAEQTANSYGKEWISYLRIARWDANTRKLVFIERLRINDKKAFLKGLRDGDVLTFSAPVCRF